MPQNTVWNSIQFNGQFSCYENTMEGFIFITNHKLKNPFGYYYRYISRQGRWYPMQLKFSTRTLQTAPFIELCPLLAVIRNVISYYNTNYN